MKTADEAGGRPGSKESTLSINLESTLMLPGVGEEGVLRDLAGVLGVHGAPRFRRHLLAHVAMASAPLA